ncbi:MAG: HD domain-containing protein [Lachnospiraceae bacterium]|nr:HD domain-containing protein [Lachnospiraceae bacterium]
MKLIKRIPFQMFILNLIASIVCVTGVLVVRYTMNEISAGYKHSIEENVRDRLNMSDLCRMMGRHHIILSWHTLTDSSEEKQLYEEKATLLQQDIMDKLDEMIENISLNEEEQLFHTVYSNTVSYFSNADNVFKMSREGNNDTAKYYITSYLADSIDEITDDIDLMDEYIAKQMNATSEKIEHSIYIAKISEKICIFSMCLVMAICIILCTSITSRLEKYKNELEKENELKTQTLIWHNHRMLAIQENAIIGMAGLIESRDQDTGEHVKRTSRYVELLAHAAQKAGYCTDILTDDYTELLIKAAPMHDIGKIAVSDAILQKPGRLTDEEFEEMKKHTTAGGRIIVEVMSNIEEKRYIDIATQVAEAHHEKWDGSGYPKGLKGDEIPIGARIMAVADVFDALVSKRCYKEPMPMDKAFDIIRESGGSHFDPELAGLFCGIRREVEAVHGQ